MTISRIKKDCRCLLPCTLGDRIGNVSHRLDQARVHRRLALHPSNKGWTTCIIVAKDGVAFSHMADDLRSLALRTPMTTDVIIDGREFDEQVRLRRDKFSGKILPSKCTKHSKRVHHKILMTNNCHMSIWASADVADAISIGVTGPKIDHIVILDLSVRILRQLSRDVSGILQLGSVELYTILQPAIPIPWDAFDRFKSVFRSGQGVEP
jgi:hypothetical protein